MPPTCHLLSLSMHIKRFAQDGSAETTKLLLMDVSSVVSGHMESSSMITRNASDSCFKGICAEVSEATWIKVQLEVFVNVTEVGVGRLVSSHW